MRVRVRCKSLHKALDLKEREGADETVFGGDSVAPSCDAYCSELLCAVELFCQESGTSAMKASEVGAKDKHLSLAGKGTVWMVSVF